MSRTYRRNYDDFWKGKTFKDGIGTKNLGHTPSSYTHEFMNRPERRDNQRLCHRILNGEEPDNIVWPLGNSKPHKYYW